MCANVGVAVLRERGEEREIETEISLSLSVYIYIYCKDQEFVAQAHLE